MADISAKDVQSLRKSTGVGMLDAKRALIENDGDIDKATVWLREQGISSAAKRNDREASQGAVTAIRENGAAAIVELRCETDFVAKSAEFVSLVDEMTAKVCAEGPGAAESFAAKIDELRTTLKENISVGQVVYLKATEGQVLDTYVHLQADRGVNAVIVQLEGGTEETAHDIAVHVAFARPEFARREEVPADQVAAERATIENISRNEGKPEAAMEKIIEGRLNGWYKDRVLLEQSYVKDEKKSIADLLGSATLVSFAQVIIGG
ncbi:MAG: translation elongation factor Ts [Actinomycetes bacterium]